MAAEETTVIEASLQEEMILEPETWEKVDALDVARKVMWKEIALKEEEATVAQDLDLDQEAETEEILEETEEMVAAEITAEVQAHQEAKEEITERMLDHKAKTEDLQVADVATVAIPKPTVTEEEALQLAKEPYQLNSMNEGRLSCLTEWMTVRLIEINGWLLNLRIDYEYKWLKKFVCEKEELNYESSPVEICLWWDRRHFLQL